MYIKILNFPLDTFFYDAMLIKESLDDIFIIYL